MLEKHRLNIVEMKTHVVFVFPEGLILGVVRIIGRLLSYLPCITKPHNSLFLRFFHIRIERSEREPVALPEYLALISHFNILLNRNFMSKWQSSIP